MRIAEDGVEWLVTNVVRIGGWPGTFPPTRHQAPRTARPGSASPGTPSCWSVATVSAGAARRPARAGRVLGGHSAARGPRGSLRHGHRRSAAGVQPLRVCARTTGRGLVLVRALWLAEVRPDPWQPQFEIARRRLVPCAEAFDSIWIEAGFGPLYRRISSRPRFPSGSEMAAASAWGRAGGEERIDRLVTGGCDCQVGAPAACLRSCCRWGYSLPLRTGCARAAHGDPAAPSCSRRPRWAHLARSWRSASNASCNSRWAISLRCHDRVSRTMPGGTSRRAIISSCGCQGSSSTRAHQRLW